MRVRQLTELPQRCVADNLTRRVAQYRIEGRYGYFGSLYKPTVIRVICCIRRSPLLKHQRSKSPLREGTRKPAPRKVGAAEISAFNASFDSATAWPPYPIPLA